MEPGFHLRFDPPTDDLADFVESIGTFHNNLPNDKEIVVLPDGRVDLFFWKQPGEPIRIILIGLETEPEQRFVPPGVMAYVISFKPLAVEYILKYPIAAIVNTARELNNDFWDLDFTEFTDFNSFYQKISDKVISLLPEFVDERKRRLFQMIYTSSGEMPVSELSDKTGWSSRQINRYFNQWLGLSLKAYCTILRFRASLSHIARGKLFPKLSFSDQNHFIKQVKKFSGVVPKELNKNKNDRFVLLSVLKRS
ncbi:helix-turn-helix domain-containing protein [Mucilaginibacter defluvii]|uniref:HTH araC/xylS-type domain-containing protein n=1 Tax=Mucilaginibacter defluvii TaxID=1196019 RepID=A0ABP9FSP9_9SPHI